MQTFSENLIFGQIGESAISKWLQSHGYSVFPAYQIEQNEGKGPQLFSTDKNLVLPDLLGFKKKKIQWFEVKHKKRFAWHRNTQSWTTGIDLRHYEEYQEVAKVTQLDVWLLFWHPLSLPSESDLLHGCPKICPTGLFGENIQKLRRLESHRSNRHGNSGMVYWSHNSLIHIAKEIYPK
jgi:hypothetical protein